MRKVPTYFERDWSGDRSRVTATVNPACQWVADGEGVATQKLDGTCALIRGGAVFKRREIKGRERPGAVTLPADFEECERDYATGKIVGWVPVGDGPEDAWFREAFAKHATWADGTYELIGPKVQGNPECWASHSLIAHSTLALTEQPPRDFEGLREWMAGRNIEGVVWHHRDGRMAKLKLRDFGIARPSSETPVLPSERSDEARPAQDTQNDKA